MWRQVQFVQGARHLVQVQAGDVLRYAMFNDLANVPSALEGIGEIEPVGAPDDMSRWRDDGRGDTSVQRAGPVSPLCCTTIIPQFALLPARILRRWYMLDITTALQ